ncbi:hypothetical protein SAMN05428976_11319 [Clostridium sp. USBA 49]|uniref:hypothetical protein n=1 Tax=Clostridium sp. USBA 49 TaxID=1881060 RepID=UPI00099AD7FC|nr:hypothetical protein [Clostridium sp. USBA 49]SKA89498.1 hypothetical protein SAMN05428976_11319 [Clostridium sp. USBA 49]
MILQERINELGSGILIINNSKIELIGFTCPERLYDYYNNHMQCYFSMGIYDLKPLDFTYIQNNALFIVEDKNLVTTSKHYFKLLKKDTVKYKTKDKKYTSKVYSISKNEYTNKYRYKDMEISILFDTKEDLLKYFKERFNKEIVF